MQLLHLTLLVAVWTLVSALPLPADSSVKSPTQGDIIRYQNENDGSGNYRFSFETSDGTKRDESGFLVHPGQPDAHIVVVGSYTYIRPDGKYETISYVADENGYRITNTSDTREDIPERMFAPNAAIVATLLG